MTIEQRLERLEKQAGITEQPDWPPAGVAIEMWDEGDEYDEYVIRVSSGGGRYYEVNGNIRIVSNWDNWRYHVPPWPESVDAWVVASDGSCFFAHRAANWPVGQASIQGTVVAVIQREERE